MASVTAELALAYLQLGMIAVSQVRHDDLLLEGRNQTVTHGGFISPTNPGAFDF